MAEYLQPEKKQEIFAKYGKSNKDTGRLVSKRRQLLNYLQKVDIERYRALIKELGLRR